MAAYLTTTPETPALDRVFGEVDPPLGGGTHMLRRHVMARRIVRPVIEAIEEALYLLVMRPWDPVWPWALVHRLDNWYWTVRAFRKDRLW